METENIKGKIVSGIFWNIINLIIRRGLDFVIKLILVKLLFPEEFGLVGMATVFISFVQVFNELGFGAALVQRKEEDLNESHYYTSFWTGIVWSVLLYIIMLVGVGPLAAYFYHEPILVKIIPVLSLGILASPVNLVHRAQLTKNMDFKKLMIINNASTIFSGILGLSLALLGAGVWSLVVNSVASYIVAIPLYFNATRWKPKLKWEKKSFKEIFNFGIYTTGTSFFNNVTNKLDYLLIGRLVSASALGAYTLAFILTDTFRGYLMKIFNDVMYPVYGRKQDDLISIKKYYLNVIKYNSIVVYPIMIFLITLGEPLIITFFGEKWQESIVPMKILAIAVMFHMMVNSNTSLIRGLGKPDLEMKLQMFKSLFIFAPAVFIGTYWFGIIGTASAVLLNKISAVIIAQHYLKRLVNISFWELIASLKGPILGSLASLITGLVLFHLEVHFIICTFFLFFSYVVIIWLLMKDELKNFFSELRNLKKKTLTASRSI